MQRFLVVSRENIHTDFFTGYLYGIFDMERRVFVITEQFGVLMDEKEAREIAKQLNRVHDAERFSEFLRSGCVYRTRKQHVGKFSTEFKRWLRGNKLPEVETVVGFDTSCGWFLRIKTGGVIDV